MNKKQFKEISLSEELENILTEMNTYIKPIGIDELQNWVDWLIMKTERAIKKQDILNAIANFEKNWSLD